MSAEFEASRLRQFSFEGESAMEKIILWLLGVPLSVILVLWLVLGIH
jgi:hypothetical protein